MQLNELLSCKNLKYEKSINLHKLINCPVVSDFIELGSYNEIPWSKSDLYLSLNLNTVKNGYKS